MENITEDGPDQFGKAVGRQIKAVREALGLTQDEVARRLTANGHPMTRVTVTRTENGSRPLIINDLAAFAEVLQVPVANLYRQAEEDHLVNSQEADFLGDQIVWFNELDTTVASIEGRLNTLRRFIAGEKRRVDVRRASLTEGTDDGEHPETP